MTMMTISEERGERRRRKKEKNESDFDEGFEYLEEHLFHHSHCPFLNPKQEEELISMVFLPSHCIEQTLYSIGHSSSLPSSFGRKRK